MKDNLKSIRIGTAGYSYSDWEGIFYPEGVKKGGEKIKHYLKYFDTLEIDSSYYRILQPGYFWFIVKNTPKDFLVTLKMHQNITHHRESFEDTRKEFYNSIKPLIQTEREFVVLFQFPYSFKFNLENLEYLRRISVEFDFKKAIEFRNYSWDKKEVYDFLKEYNFIMTNIDTPKVKGLFPSDVNEITNSIGYFRLHGRNKDKWWKPGEVHERYNYEYSDDEIENEIKKRVLKMINKLKKLVVIFNNHYQAKAVRNAIKLKKSLSE